MLRRECKKRTRDQHTRRLSETDELASIGVKWEPRRHFTFGERLILTQQGEKGVFVHKTRPASPVGAGAS